VKKLMASHGSWTASPGEKRERVISREEQIFAPGSLCRAREVHGSWREQTGSGLSWKENDSAEVFPPPFSGRPGKRRGAATALVEYVGVVIWGSAVDDERPCASQ